MAQQQRVARAKLVFGKSVVTAANLVNFNLGGMNEAAIWSGFAADRG